MDENQIDIYCSEHECITRAYQEAKVCVPVTITPFANIGDITTECCGKAVVAREGNCKGKTNKSCKFTISQKIKVEIPVEFGANTNVGGTFVDCDCVNEDEN